MPYLLIDHAVEDFETWKPYFDDHAATREERGSQGGTLFRAADDPDHAVVLFEWDAVENARAFADSADLRETMAEAGVEGEPELLFLEKVEDVAV